jgi:hypothetical protein
MLSADARWQCPRKRKNKFFDSDQEREDTREKLIEIVERILCIFS